MEQASRYGSPIDEEKRDQIEDQKEIQGDNRFKS